MIKIIEIIETIIEAIGDFLAAIDLPDLDL